MKVSEIMSKAVVIDDKVMVRDAAKIMSDKNIGSLIIINGNTIIGIITERDILKNLAKVNAKISSVMTRKVVTIDSDSSIEDAIALMSKNRIKRLPVMRNGKLMGLVSATDIIAYSDVDESDFMFN